jgi:hypothetical protein
MTDKCRQKNVPNSKFNVESTCEIKMVPFHLKNEDGVDFRYCRKCRYFENISFELAAVDYSQPPLFILIRFCKIRNFLTKGLRESACIQSDSEISLEKKPGNW